MDIRVSDLDGLKPGCNSQIFLLAEMGADNILEAACIRDITLSPPLL